VGALLAVGVLAAAAAEEGRELVDRHHLLLRAHLPRGVAF
jgi:hypothetical protein